MSFPVVALRRFVVDACDGPFGSAITGEHYSDEGARVIRLGNIGNASWLDDDAAYLPLEYWSTLSSHHARRGDLVVAALGDESHSVGRACVVPDLGPALVKADCFRLRLDDARIDSRFVARFLSSAAGLAEAMKLADGATRLRLTLGKALAIMVPDVSLSTQQTIADYLDRETAHIDALGGAKRRMAELLEESQHALRETLIPAGWQDGPTVRLDRLLQEVDDRLHGADPPPLLSVSIHRGVIPYADANPDREPRADDLANYKRCRADDIVLNRMRAFQGGIGRAREDGIVSPDYAVLRPTHDAVAGYLNHLLRSPWFVGEMKARLRGIGSSEQGNVRTPRINWDDLRTVIVPAPPVEEQMRRADELDAALANASRTRSAIDRQLALVQERRQALITAAVTGQLDIPEAA